MMDCLWVLWSADFQILDSRLDYIRFYVFLTKCDWYVIGILFMLHVLIHHFIRSVLFSYVLPQIDIDIHTYR